MRTSRNYVVPIKIKIKIKQREREKQNKRLARHLATQRLPLFPPSLSSYCNCSCFVYRFVKWSLTLASIDSSCPLRTTGKGLCVDGAGADFHLTCCTINQQQRGSTAQATAPCRLPSHSRFRHDTIVVGDGCLPLWLPGCLP